jgi:hypothetical protein
VAIGIGRLLLWLDQGQTPAQTARPIPTNVVTHHGRLGLDVLDDGEVVLSADLTVSTESSERGESGGKVRCTQQPSASKNVDPWESTREHHALRH